MSATETTPSTHGMDGFVSTRWTVVLAAGRKSSAASDRALSELCQTYWYPLYAYVRRRGHSREDAEDLVQGFFSRFLEKNYLAGLSAEKGRFRAFLLASLKHFLANEWDKSQRQKRGGGAPHLALDWHQAAERFQIDAGNVSDPEHAYDREWAVAVLERVIQRLSAECDGAGRGDLFANTRRFLMADEPAHTYSKAAAVLGMEEGALRVAVHRLRKRFRELLREEIAETLADPDQVTDELQSLRLALS